MKTFTFVAILTIIGIILLSGCVEIEPPATGEFCVKKESGEKLSLSEAKDIAIKSECGDRLKDSYFCNEITGTWWIDLSLEKEGCNPACVINVVTKEAEINWRCTGLITKPPVKEVTIEESREIAKDFILNSPTYKFDGFGLEHMETIAYKCPSCWLFKFKFSSRHAGYGDRNGKILAQVIVPHTGNVMMANGKITSANLDDKWDMIKQVLLSSSSSTVSKEMTYGGTNYVNCQLNPDYPFEVDEEPTSVSGIVKEESGSRMFPWRAAVIEGHYLFNPLTRNLLYNFDELVGKRITIKGYLGQGQVVMKVPFEENKFETIVFDDTLYVSEIVGWRNICCDATLEDTRIINTADVCFWFKNDFVPRNEIVRL